MNIAGPGLDRFEYYQVNQIDKLTYAMAILHKKDGADLIKESANSHGDYGLNRDAE